MTDPPPPQASPVDPPSDGKPPAGGKPGPSPKKGYTKPREEREQVPIEELYDLSKPIKRIERPSRDEHEKQIAELDAFIQSIRDERRALQEKIDSALGKKDDGSPLARERDALNKIKNQKGLMIEQKRQIRTRLEIVKADGNRLIDQAKSARSGMKFSNVAEIEKEIARLQRKQETQSMSLSDEKKLIKEIDFLTASRRTAEEIAAKQDDINIIKADRKAISAELDAKNSEIDAIQKEVDAQAAVVKKLNEKQSNQRGQVGELIKKREELKNQVDGKIKEKNELRAEFREKTNDWYQCQRALKAQRQIQYDEEKKRREEEQAAWLKKKEEEELAKTPYEEEMALCEYLADYLTKTYLTDSQAEAEKRAAAAEEKAKADVVAVKDDPFAGFKAVSKKKDDDEDMYFGKGRGKKGRGGGKSKKAPKAAAFSISLDLFEQFGMISLAPPTSLGAVPASVEELKAKKAWYSEQPRGSVPTARDIVRKAKEEAAAKSGKSKGNGKKKGNFSISSDEFAPLSS